ncbi:MAG: hypothetical protein FWF44_07770 [Defluviitaleaceae bacterium]|nr:hypothetical protein [Defluviitaleaceae bacterium]
MSFSNDTQQKMDEFAREQSRRYLDKAEMTYMEKLREKAGGAKRKAAAKLARFKGSSERGKEAYNDMVLYMSDYMNDLIAQGMPEKEAFEQARAEMAVSDADDRREELREHFNRYYGENSAEYETIGLFYAGFSSLGLFVGALTGYAQSGGRLAFLGGGWIDTIIGAVIGVLIGTALGQVAHAVITALKKR